MMRECKKTSDAIKKHKEDNGFPVNTSQATRIKGLATEAVLTEVLGGIQNVPVQGDSETFHWDINFGDKKMEVKSQIGVFGTESQPIELLKDNCAHIEENERWRDIDYLLVVTLMEDDNKDFNVITPRVLVCPKTDPNFKFVDSHRKKGGKVLRCVHYSAQFDILSER